MKITLFTTVGAAAMLLATSCAVNPVTGKKEVILVSEGQEVAMGAQSRRTTINGFPALVFTADQVQQDPQSGQQVAGVRVLGHIIQDGKTLYAIMGVAAPADFPTYSPQFSSVAGAFRRLTDADKLNRQPERIRIVKLKLRSNLKEALTKAGIADKRLEELAILNGMPLNEQVNAGSLIKTVGK